MIKKIDKLFFAFVLLTSLMILAGMGYVESPYQLLLQRFVIIVAIVLFIIISKGSKNQLTEIIRDGYPLIFSAYFYQETVFYNKIFFSNIDNFLNDADMYLFGYQPSVMFSLKLPNLFFSELMYISYFSFYLLIIAVVLVLFFKQRERFPEYIFYLSASLYLFYLLFMLIPSEGPQFYFGSPENQPPEAYFFDKLMHFIQEFGEQPTGAFPSSHIGFSLIILYVFYKFHKPFFYIAMPIVFLLILATVYIKAHYVVDVFGGLVSAPLFFKTSKLIYGKIT
ncbi:MAG: phosphatase PAP2 family protein [Chlorobi bacterium]|nr:phosphatase PAP2 family protein [Chlorobiota bacterium]